VALDALCFVLSVWCAFCIGAPLVVVNVRCVSCGVSVFVSVFSVWIVGRVCLGVVVAVRDVGLCVCVWYRVSSCAWHGLCGCEGCAGAGCHAWI